MLQINYWCQNLIQISLIGSFKSFQSQSAAIRLQLFCHSPPPQKKIIQNNNNPSSSVSNWVVSLWFGEPPAARLKLMQCGSCDYAAWFINSTRDFKTNNKTRASCAARWEKRQTTSNQSPRWWWWWKPVVFVCRPVFFFLFFPTPLQQQQQQPWGSGDSFPLRCSPERLPELSAQLTQATGDTAFRETGVIFPP